VSHRGRGRNRLGVPQRTCGRRQSIRSACRACPARRPEDRIVRRMACAARRGGTVPAG